MGVYIDKFEPKYGLYQIDQGKIHKYKGKGGTVRVYPIQEIDLVRCGECEYADEYNHCKYSAWWNGNADFCSHGIRRKENR